MTERRLQTFLHDGSVEIGSDRAENLDRLFALTRTNALFASHDEGCRSSGRTPSLITPAKFNGAELLAYARTRFCVLKPDWSI